MATLREHSGLITVVPVFLLALGFCLAPTAARAGTITFNSAETGTLVNWGDTSTWSGAVVPVTNDDVYLTSTAGSLGSATAVALNVTARL